MPPTSCADSSPRAHVGPGLAVQHMPHGGFRTRSSALPPVVLHRFHTCDASLQCVAPCLVLKASCPHHNACIRFELAVRHRYILSICCCCCRHRTRAAPEQPHRQLGASHRCNVCREGQAAAVASTAQSSARQRYINMSARAVSQAMRPSSSPVLVVFFRYGGSPRNSTPRLSERSSG